MKDHDPIQNRGSRSDDDGILDELLIGLDRDPPPPRDGLETQIVAALQGHAETSDSNTPAIASAKSRRPRLRVLVSSLAAAAAVWLTWTLWPAANVDEPRAPRPLTASTEQLLDRVHELEQRLNQMRSLDLEKRVAGLLASLDEIRATPLVAEASQGTPADRNAQGEADDPARSPATGQQEPPVEPEEQEEEQSELPRWQEGLADSDLDETERIGLQRLVWLQQSSVAVLGADNLRWRSEQLAAQYRGSWIADEADRFSASLPR